MRVTIHSDGTPHSTHVKTPSGETIPGITRIEWELDAYPVDVARVKVYAGIAAAEVVGEAEFFPIVTDAMVADAAWAMGQACNEYIPRPDLELLARAALTHVLPQPVRA